MKRPLIAGLLAGLLVVAGCGDDSADDSSAVTAASDSSSAGAADPTVPPTSQPSVDTTTSETSPPTTAAPATTEPSAATTAPVGDGPQRIVSLASAATEMMFAIGADDLLVAVDDYSYYPPEALDLPHELSAYEPNVEAIAGYEPDLVLISGDFTGLGDQLAALDIEVWDGPAAVTLDDTYRQIEELGAITGHQDAAAELNARMQSDIDEIVDEVAVMEEPLTYYHELDETLFSVTSDTFIGEIYSMLGLENIADEVGDAAGGYPQLNAEYIISADPDLIFLADTKCCAQTAQTVAERPGWDTITAVTDGNVVEMDDDIASRWGPRIVDHLRAAADAVSSATVAS